MEHVWTRRMVLLISIFLLSSCGGSTTSTPNALTPEGTTASPITILPANQNSATPNSGHVGNSTTGSKSYYRATGLTGGNKYTVTLYGPSADADLWVYNDLPFDYITGPVCKSQNGGTSAEQCVVTAIGSTMNIEIDGQYSLSGATYSISVNHPVTPPITCSAGSNCFDFSSNPLPADFPAPFVLTTTGGVAPLQWNLDTGSVFGTGNSIRSSGLNNSETSCFSYTTTTSTDSYVSFDLMVSSSTQYYDLLLFYVDNVLQLPAWSGGFSQHVMFNTTTGTHTYKWCHTNNDTGTSGAVWVDNIYIQ